MENLKPHLSFDEQVQLFKTRGFIIADEVALKNFLEHNNYYRFTSYLLDYKHCGNYKTGVNIDDAINLYILDSKLRMWLYTVLEAIEISAKTTIAYTTSKHYGNLCYRDKNIFREKFANSKHYDIYLSKLDRSKKENRMSPVIKHHDKKYDGRIPFWAFIEFFTFGMLSKFYLNLKAKDQKAIAGCYNIHFKSFRSWLKVASDLRNKVAHYNRIYNVSFNNVPHSMDNSLDNKLFSQIVALKELYPDKQKWNEKLKELKAIITDEKCNFNYKQNGFRADWEKFLTA